MTIQLCLDYYLEKVFFYAIFNFKALINDAFTVVFVNAAKSIYTNSDVDN